MKIYFGFTVAGDRSSVVAARKIVMLLEEMGHEVLTRHLVQNDAWEADRLITPREVYKRDMKWLEQCDVFMAEVSVRHLASASRPATFWEQPRKK